MMNVKQSQDHVMLMLFAPTLMGVMSALVTVGTAEMDLHARVILYVRQVLELA